MNIILQTKMCTIRVRCNIYLKNYCKRNRKPKSNKPELYIFFLFDIKNIFSNQMGFHRSFQIFKNKFKLVVLNGLTENEQNCVAIAADMPVVGEVILAQSMRGLNEIPPIFSSVLKKRHHYRGLLRPCWSLTTNSYYLSKKSTRLRSSA